MSGEVWLNWDALIPPCQVLWKAWLALNPARSAPVGSVPMRHRWWWWLPQGWKLAEENTAGNEQVLAPKRSWVSKNEDGHSLLVSWAKNCIESCSQGFFFYHTKYKQESLVSIALLKSSHRHRCGCHWLVWLSAFVVVCSLAPSLNECTTVHPGLEQHLWLLHAIAMFPRPTTFFSGNFGHDLHWTLKCKEKKDKTV